MDEENVTQKDEQNEAPEQTNEAPEQEQPVQDEQPQATSDEQPVEAQEETPQPEATEDNKDSDSEEADESDTLEYYNDYLNKSGQNQMPELQVGDDGTLDVNNLNQWAQGVVQSAQYQSAKQFAELREEDRQWSKVYEKYPEVRENKKLRDLVHKQRLGNITAGGKNDVVKAAKEIFALRSEGLTEGKKSAQQSITRQKSADLETASTPTDTTSSRREELSILMTSRSRRVAEGARQQLLKDLIERGEI